MPTQAESFKLIGAIGKRTEKALQFTIHSIWSHGGSLLNTLEFPQTEWFPFSQIMDEMESESKDCDELYITKWIAEKKELV